MAAWVPRVAKGKRDINASLQGGALERNVDRCMVGMDRFSLQLLHHPNVQEVMCYSFTRQFDEYMSFLATKLEHRRVEAKYFRQFTNMPRTRTGADWDAPTREFIEKYLRRKYDYYQFCFKCIGSSKDLIFRR